MESKKKKFKTKSFATFTISWIFLILTFTGSVIYFTPAGRIANWTNWTFMGLTKDEWQGFHVIFASLFILFIVLHLFFNWKVLMSYFKSKKFEGIRLKRELTLATAIVGIFVIITIIKWQPVWILMEWREDIKQSERVVETAPPIPHTEDMTINEIASLLNMQVDEMLDNIKAKGYDINDTAITLALLAEQNNTTPEKIYTEIVGENQLQSFSGSGGGEGSGLGRKSIEERSEILKNENKSGSRYAGESPGYGRKTIKELCAEAGIPVEKGIANLKSKGIDAKAGDRVRNLATKNNLRPSDIALYLEKK
ncbi:DUF4405 domain-containing protein [candidate division KSB1 bacterium]